MQSDRATPASMSKEEFQKVGHYQIDSIADLLDNIGDGPVTPSI